MANEYLFSVKATVSRINEIRILQFDGVKLLYLRVCERTFNVVVLKRWPNVYHKHAQIFRRRCLYQSIHIDLQATYIRDLTVLKINQFQASYNVKFHSGKLFGQPYVLMT